VGLFGERRQGVKLVRDGASFRAECSTCGKRATFREVEVKSSYYLFGVNLLDDSDAGVRCDECDTAFTEDDAIELLDRAQPLDPEQQVEVDIRKMARYKAEFEARARRRHADAAEVRSHEEKRRAREADVDRELAALKRRIGK
jgi:hypothetical protein